jgi:hypothetical protein
MNKIKILSCPNCGGKPNYVCENIVDGYVTVGVECSNCHTTTFAIVKNDTINYNTRKMIKQWNRRTIVVVNHCLEIQL